MNLSRALRFLVTALLAGSPAFAAGGALSVALLPVVNQAGDSAAAAAVTQALVRDLGRSHRVIEGEGLRDELRAMRLRNLDQAPAERIRLLGRKVGAGEILVVSLHQAERRNTPRLTLSARAYAVATGDLIWCGFASKSGLDRRTVLGLGVVDDLDLLASSVVAKVLSTFGQMPSAAAKRRAGSSPLGGNFEPVAIVPFSAETEHGGLNAAETANEALRAVLFRDGFRLLSPNAVSDVLRHRSSLRWGGVSEPVRRALARAGARAIITGSIDEFDIGGGELEPNPHVALYVRMLSADSGRILWMGGLDREGWDRPGLFHFGRIYSRGSLLELLAARLMKRMERDASRGEFFSAAKELK
ncbi:MAG TPA: hypothetical protein VKA53_11465 [Thermoanaerobaculia bacterium]|nr:hypothetical protein [Thermoanaerobaculia bacterium]